MRLPILFCLAFGLGFVWSVVLVPQSSTDFPVITSYTSIASHSTHSHHLSTSAHYPHSTATSYTLPSPSHQLEPSRIQKLSRNSIAIVFGCLGGLACLGLFISLGRCLYSYRKTPRRDRVAAFVNRHRLEREMEELAHRDLRRSTLLRHPPPPYFPPPPAYDHHGTPTQNGVTNVS